MKKPKGCSAHFSQALSKRLFVIFLALAMNGMADPVGPEMAASAAEAWTKKTLQGKKPGAGTITRKSADGTPLFHVVPLQGGGFVVTSADDENEPVLAFSNEGSFDNREDSPVADLLEKEMARKAQEKKNRPPQAFKLPLGDGGRALAKKSKWRKLAAPKTAAPMATSGTANPALEAIDDVCVAPLLQTKWGQTVGFDTATNKYVAVYNYYTPNPDTGLSTPGYTENDPSGCTATALAQILRYWKWPNTGVGKFQNLCEIETVSGALTKVNLSSIGGDGNGGPYDWANMPTDPHSVPITLAQQKAIGALCYDIGVSVSMSYSPWGSGGWAFAESLRKYFKYPTAAMYRNCWTETRRYDEPTARAIRTNLDAGMPVAVTLEAHEVVADGYGYFQGTPYTHLNFGWYGGCNLWYNLPVVDTVGYTSNAVYEVTFNIDPQGTGEVVSGRATYSDGKPMGGKIVELSTVEGTLVASATTKSTGIYAFKGLQPNTSYKVRLQAPYVDFPQNPKTITTGSSGPKQDGSWIIDWDSNNWKWVPVQEKVDKVVGNQIADFGQNSGAPALQVEFREEILQSGDILDFGDTRTTGTTSTILLRNVGQSLLTELIISKSGDDDFGVSQTGTAAALRTGEALKLTAKFQPKANGTRSATLSFSTPSGIAFQIQIEGNGCLPPDTSGITTQSLMIGGTSKTSLACSGATSYSATGLPAGMAINTQTGEITGQPARSGTYQFTLTVTNAYGSSNKTVALVVSNPPAPVFASNSGINAILGYPSRGQIAVQAQPGYKITYSATGLPPGLQINAATGSLGGIPTKSGTFTARMAASNGYSTAWLNIPVKVTASNWSPRMTFSGTTGAPVSFQLPTTVSMEGTQYPITYGRATLPLGLQVSSQGLVSGTAKTSGKYTVVIPVQNGFERKTAILTLDIVQGGNTIMGEYKGTGKTASSKALVSPQHNFSVELKTKTATYNIKGTLDPYGNWEGQAEKGDRLLPAQLQLKISSSGTCSLSGRITDNSRKLEILAYK